MTLAGLVAGGVLLGAGTPAAHAEPAPRVPSSRAPSSQALVGGASRVSALTDPAAPAGATDGTALITGSGFGHGVGMSQYGAFGMARAGAAAPAILQHYFAGTTVASYPDAVDLRVNVVDRGSRVTLRTASLAPGGGAFRLFPAGADPIDLAEGDLAVISVASGGGLSVTLTQAGAAGPQVFTTASLAVRWSGARAMDGPATLLRVDSRSANGASTTTKMRRYRWGSLSLNAVPRAESGGATRTRIEANLLLSLHNEYLRGLSEMPSSWPDAALQAQAIAGRNYALTHVGRPMAACGGCVLWDDTRSQVYRGWEKESTTGAARWLAAVDATRTSPTEGLTVLYQGTPITAYYSAASGGRTRDAARVWGTAVPYLRSVDDAWSTDPAVNPGYAAWTRKASVRSLLAAFGLPDLVSVVVTDRDDSGAALRVVATSSDGRTASLTGSAFAYRYGLPAQWVTGVQLPLG